MTDDTDKRIALLNQNREKPESLLENDNIYRKECRRNKITRFSKRIVKQNNGVTLLTLDNQKLHKSKIKRKHKT